MMSKALANTNLQGCHFQLSFDRVILRRRQNLFLLLGLCDRLDSRLLNKLHACGDLSLNQIDPLDFGVFHELNQRTRRLGE